MLDLRLLIILSRTIMYWDDIYFGHRHAFEAMSFIAETFIFLYVGMDALDIEKWKMSQQR